MALNSTELFGQSNEISSVFPALKSTNHFQSSSMHCLVGHTQVQTPTKAVAQIRTPTTLTLEGSIINIDMNITDNIIMNIINVKHKPN